MMGCYATWYKNQFRILFPLELNDSFTYGYSENKGIEVQIWARKIIQCQEEIVEQFDSSNKQSNLQNLVGIFLFAYYKLIVVIRRIHYWLVQLWLHRAPTNFLIKFVTRINTNFTD